MTVPVIGLRDTCRRLRALEEAIARQRKRVAAQGEGRRAETARATLATLLAELDDLLAAADMRPTPHV
ncbi:MAG TPA: hypothetical protein VK438_19835 [Xanthobacteraceae bacterium]|nr:hypothetical protein [Xanthobacteraceae bacterium]